MPNHSNTREQTVLHSVRRPHRRPLRAIITVVLIASMTTLSSAAAQPLPLGSETHSMSGAQAPQGIGLAQAIPQIRSRIAQIQAALDRNHQGGSVNAGTQPVQIAMGDDMGMGGAQSNPTMNSNAMPAAAGCCSAMMGNMGASGSAPTAMLSDLPGFPGASHIYHVGATGFFLSYAAAIKLTTNQQAALNGIRQKSIGDMAASQRQIDQAEQELWVLTSSDQPDSMAIEMKVRAIETLKSDQRIAFIRSVGEAARVLTDEQRAVLLGTGAPQAAQMPAPQGSAGSMNPQGAAGSTDPKGGMAGMGDDNSMGKMGSNTPAPNSNNGGMGGM